MNGNRVDFLLGQLVRMMIIIIIRLDVQYRSIDVIIMVKVKVVKESTCYLRL